MSLNLDYEDYVDGSPEDRAKAVVRKLEDAIVHGRESVHGMPYKKWQDIAVLEISKALRIAEELHKENSTFNKTVLRIITTSLTTIGFWTGVLLIYQELAK